MPDTRLTPLTPDLDAVIARYATVAFTGATPLHEAGVDSLSLLRLASEVLADVDAEIDATRLVDLRTIDDLKAWLADPAGPAAPGGGTC
jgi:hypothetical protein